MKRNQFHPKVKKNLYRLRKQTFILYIIIHLGIDKWDVKLYFIFVIHNFLLNG